MWETALRDLVPLCSTPPSPPQLLRARVGLDSAGSGAEPAGQEQQLPAAAPVSPSGCAARCQAALPENLSQTPAVSREPGCRCGEAVPSPHPLRWGHRALPALVREAAELRFLTQHRAKKA